jgi:hypothetical protein
MSRAKIRYWRSSWFCVNIFQGVLFHRWRSMIVDNAYRDPFIQTYVDDGWAILI